uniref:Uncharacterized protein n=1 Tax=Anguilla anguilla TaxID=7936 RepID=A0A0E9WFH7_ANGAN
MPSTCARSNDKICVFQIFAMKIFGVCTFIQFLIC